MITLISVVFGVAIIPLLRLIHKDLEDRGTKVPSVVFMIFLAEVVVAAVVGYSQMEEESKFDLLHNTVASQTNEIAGLVRVGKVQLEQLQEFRSLFRSSPAVPTIALETHDGLPMPWIESGTVGPEQERIYRWHTLEVRNTNRVNLSSLNLELFLPEPIFRFYRTQSTAGLAVSINRKVSTMVGKSINGGTIAMSEPDGRPTRHYDIDIGLLPATGFLRLEILTVNEARRMRMMQGHEFAQGSFLFNSDNAVSRKGFFAPISFDETNRVMSLGVNRESDTLVEIQGFGF